MSQKALKSQAGDRAARFEGGIDTCEEPENHECEKARRDYDAKTTFEDLQLAALVHLAAMECHPLERAQGEQNPDVRKQLIQIASETDQSQFWGPTYGDTSSGVIDAIGSTFPGAPWEHICAAIKDLIDKGWLSATGDDCGGLFWDRHVRITDNGQKALLRLAAASKAAAVKAIRPKRRGRRPDTDKKKDAECAEMWEGGSYKTHADCAEARHMPVKEFKQALDRHRKR